MFVWAILFLIVALVAAFLGFGTLAGTVEVSVSEQFLIART